MHPLNHPTHHARQLGGTTTTTTLYATSLPSSTDSLPASTNTIKPSNPTAPKSGPILFIVLVTLLGTLLLGLIAHCCITYRKRIAAARNLTTTTQSPSPAHELPAIQAGPAPEIHGYYAPVPRGDAAGSGEGTAEEQAAAREVYGYFAPGVAPRIGDAVIARPGA